MNLSKTLDSIKADLIKQGLDCVIQPFDDLPYTQLLIYTGLDQAKRTQLIEIKVPTNERIELLAATPANECVNIQLVAFFPFEVDDLALADVAQFLHFLNFQVEVPGFYLNYIDKTILYRYVLLAENGHFPKKILMSLIGIAMFFQDVFGQTFERLAKGKTTFIDLMEEIQEILAKGS